MVGAQRIAEQVRRPDSVKRHGRSRARAMEEEIVEYGGNGSMEAVTAVWGRKARRFMLKVDKAQMVDRGESGGRRNTVD